MTQDVQQPDTWSAACYQGDCQACSGYDDDGDGLCECAHHDDEEHTYPAASRVRQVGQQQ